MAICPLHGKETSAESTSVVLLFLVPFGVNCTTEPNFPSISTQRPIRIISQKRLDAEINKKVLLCKRKRHTIPCVASTSSVVLPIPARGVPHPWPGVYSIPGQGYSIPGTWNWSLGYPPWDQWKYYGMEMGTPPPKVWTDKPTETITFSHPSDVGGNHRRTV